MNRFKLFTIALTVGVAFSSCEDDGSGTPSQYPAEWEAITINSEEETYAGGKLGTSFISSQSAYEQPTAACEEQGFGAAFQYGEFSFERDFNTNTEGARIGLGPLYIRQGCLYCHPGYGHGKRQNRLARGGKESPPRFLQALWI